MSPRPAEGIAPSSASRRRLGLVLSGGGSRGLAHIGVLRALAEADIAPDCIAGVSAGALVGALHAAGHPPAEMVEFFRETHPFRSRNVAFARPGIWDTQKYVPALQRYFPDDRFEALRCVLRVLTTDLIAGEARVFESGPLIGPLLASSAVPLVFSPMEIDGRWYGDGGIIDNFPVGLLEERCEVILGVHVNPLREIGPDDLSSSFSVLERALDVGMYAQSRENFHRCGVVIQPQELISYGLFDTRHFVEIEQAGYAEAVRQMPEIRRLLA